MRIEGLDSRNRRTRACIAVLLALGAAIGAGRAEAQEAGDLIRIVPARHDSPGFNLEGAPLLIDTSAPVVNLLQRAEEGIARGDWKLVIDSLQRVIDDPEGALVARSEGTSAHGILYESARRQAASVLAGLPAEGLLAYRLFYDGGAKRIFERARVEHDHEALRLIASRYLLTSYGDDASEVLASWALDEGRPGEVLALLTDLVELVPDRDVPEQLVIGKLTAAYAMLGQMEKAREVVAAWERQVGKEATRQGGDHDPCLDAPWPNCLAALLPRCIGAGPVPHGRVTVWGEYQPGPPLNPSLGASVPWMYELPGSTADLWRRIFDDDPSAALVLPLSQFVSDGTRLFVRKADGCVALDLNDLMVSWESIQRRPSRRIRPDGNAPIARNNASKQPPEEREENYIGGAISIAHGLVFAVETGGVGGRLDPTPAVLPPNRMTGVKSAPTRLVAHDAGSGELRWQIGTGDDPEDELSDVQFRAAPVGVGGHLWVPYFKQSDLFVAVLNPTDGSLVRSVLLGSAREPINPVAPTLLQSTHDGLVFVPSGFGALFALNAADVTVRWAYQYDRGHQPRRDARRTPVTAWLPTAPVVAGGLVLLAATDRQELLALSASRGEKRWSASVDHSSYVIAADSTRIWLGGRNISCLSLADGKPVWTTRLVAVPTGRGVVSGETIFVPTSEGLLSLDADTGEGLGVQPTPPSQTPLGDLFCSGTALFSIDPSSVRKFPDLERTHTTALARRAQHPTDPAAAIQLAWIELLRGEPGLANDVLQQISTAALEVHDAGRRQLESPSRVRMETAISLAEKAPGGSPEALRWLQVASESALAGADRLRCRLAIADQHIVGDRYAEAYENLLQLGLSPEADRVVHATESVETLARTQIAERLKTLREKLSTEQVSRLDKEIGRQVSLARQSLRDGREVRNARGRLQALADLATIGAGGQKALLELANWEQGELRFERAEQLLMEGARRRFDLGAVAATLELCELYGPSAQDQISAMMPCLDALEERYGSEPFPEEYLSLPAAEANVSRPGAGGLVTEWVTQVRSAIPSAVRDAYHATSSDSRHNPAERTEWSEDAAWSYHAPEGSYLGRFVRVESAEDVEGAFGGSPLLNDRVLLYRTDGVLDCISAQRGELLWQSRLQVPEVFGEPPALPNNTPPLEPTRRAVTDGQIAVFNHADGLFAVGIVTGRRLWVRPYEFFNESNDSSRRDWAMSAVDGLLAASPRQGRLTLMRMIDGFTVWERDLRGEPVDAIWMNADRVIAADATRQRVHLYDRADGRLVKQILFRQADPSQRIAGLVRTGGLIVGPDAAGASHGVMAVDDALGNLVWRIELDKPAVQLFELQEGYVGIGLGHGMVRIVDANNGETIQERQVSGAQSVTGGMLFDGLLVVRADTVRGQKQSVQLAAFDVATGEEVWRREDISSVIYPDEPMRIENGAIPALVEKTHTEISPAGAAMPRTRSALVLIDARTGRNLGVGTDLTPSGMGNRFTGDVVMRRGAVVVGTQRTINAYRGTTVERDGAGRNY